MCIPTSLPLVVLVISICQQGSGWQQKDPTMLPSASALHGRYSERHFGNEAAMEHGKRLRHQSKNPEYFKSVGVTNGIRGSGSPFIDPELSTNNQTVLVGKQIILRCHIEDAANKSISWIRHTDSGLLAVNDFVYTTSHRIKVFHDNGSSEWRLSINPVELSDGGFYECQVSTTPHTSHFMAINVIEPHTTILGNKELYIEAGSTINLTCIIQAGAMRDTHIFWNYDGKIIAYDRRRGGTIVIDKRETETVTSLIISQADESDSGRYTCDPASSYPQSIIVHVTKGSDAAMRPNAIVRSKAARAILCIHLTIAAIIPWVVINVNHVFLR